MVPSVSRPSVGPESFPHFLSRRNPTIFDTPIGLQDVPQALEVRDEGIFGERVIVADRGTSCWHYRTA